MEYVDVVDKYGTKQGLIKERKDDLLKDEYFLVTHVWIINSKGEYLIQQRSKDKKVDPNLWSTTAGFVSSHETSVTACMRELEEELGILVEPMELDFLVRLYPKLPNKHIADIFLVKKDIDLDDITMQDVEVQNVGLASKKEILAMVKTSKFKDFNTLYDDYFINVLR